MVNMPIIEISSTDYRERLSYNNFVVTNYANNTGRVGQWVRASGQGYTEETVILTDFSQLLFAIINSVELDIICSTPGGQSSGVTAYLRKQNKSNPSNWYGGDIDFDSPFAVAVWSSTLQTLASFYLAGTYTFLTNATLVAYIQDCINARPQDNWGVVVAANFASQGYGLNLDSILWRINYTSPTYPVWGSYHAGYEYIQCAFCMSMGGISPDTPNPILIKSISIYCGGFHSEQVRLAIYQGGAVDNPAGATLIWDAGVTSGSSVQQWITITHPSGGVSAARNTLTWLSFKSNGSGNFTVHYTSSELSTKAGNMQTARGRFSSSAVSSDETVAYPATFPSGGSFGNAIYPIVIQYEEQIPASICIFRRRRELSVLYK